MGSETEKIRKLIDYYRKARDIAWRAESDLVGIMDKNEKDQLYRALEVARRAGRELRRLS